LTQFVPKRHQEPYWGSAVPPTVDVVADGAGGASRTGLASGFDDRAASVLDGLDEGIDPLSVRDQRRDRLRLAVDDRLRVLDVWVLGFGVVSPYDDIFDVSDWDVEFVRNLVQRPVQVESGG
jgi:hypothetical protein